MSVMGVCSREPAHPNGDWDDCRVLKDRQTQIDQDEGVDQNLREPVVVAQIKPDTTTRTEWKHFYSVQCINPL